MNSILRLALGLAALAAAGGTAYAGRTVMTTMRDIPFTVPFQSGTTVGFGYAEAIEASLTAARSASDRRVFVIGHTAGGSDPVAEEELGLDRAEKVARDLVARGIDRARIVLQSRGAQDRLARLPDETDTQWRARHGRVAVILTRRP
jgi:outer membrane protein OmpA-like peptidoglycan-associated protein